MTNIAFYGKGGIGKSTIISNVTAALAEKEYKVLQIGCDPKHDSTRLLLGGFQQSTVLEQLNRSDSVSLSEVMLTGYRGAKCIESGGPEPGVGCAGRGIIQMMNLLKNQGLDMAEFDYVFFDVLGDVVCGGFAVPMREGFAEAIYIVTSGELASLYAANNIAKGLKSHSAVKGKLAGIIGNERGTMKERELIAAFAEKIGTEMVAFIPRSELVPQAELESKTVIEYAPQSDLARIYRSIAQTIEKKGSPVIPKPLTDFELEDFISEFCHGRKSSRKVAPEVGRQQTESANNKTFVSGLVRDPNVTCGHQDNSSSPAIKQRTPLYGCSLAGAYTVVNQIRDSVAIMDSPLACAFTSLCTTMSSPSLLGSESSLPTLICTDMRERDVIFGAEKNLKEVILDTNQRLSPSATFVITSCPSGIIGEDADQIIAETRKKGLEVIALKTDGVLGGDFNAGMLTAYKTVAEYFIDENISASGDAVNVIGEKNLSTATDKNFKELKKILDFLGLKINCRFIEETDVSQIRQFKKATVNIPATDDLIIPTLMDFFADRFHVPALRAPLPLAFAQTATFTGVLGSTFGCEQRADELINRARLDYERQVAELRKLWDGKKIMIFSSIANVDWLISTLLDLKANLQKVCFSRLFYLQVIHESEFKDKIDIEHDYPLENREKDILKYNPDLVLMNFRSKQASTKHIPQDVFPFCPAYGFNSGLEIVRNWTSKLRVPFTEGWRNDEKLFQYSS
jgi:nitrogenase iron protein